jgi:hypothetical protein
MSLKWVIPVLLWWTLNYALYRITHVPHLSPLDWGMVAAQCLTVFYGTAGLCLYWDRL